MINTFQWSKHSQQRGLLVRCFNDDDMAVNILLDTYREDFFEIKNSLSNTKTVAVPLTPIIDPKEEWMISGACIHIPENEFIPKDEAGFIVIQIKHSGEVFDFLRAETELFIMAQKASGKRPLEIHKN